MKSAILYTGISNFKKNYDSIISEVKNTISHVISDFNVNRILFGNYNKMVNLTEKFSPSNTGDRHLTLDKIDFFKIKLFLDQSEDDALLSNFLRLSGITGNEHINMITSLKVIIIFEENYKK